MYLIISASADQNGICWFAHQPTNSGARIYELQVCISLSLEFGFLKAVFAPNTATLEIRPIIDKKINKVYISFNPRVGQSFHGPDRNRGLIWSPNLKAGYDVTKVIALEFEYYCSTGPLFNPDTFSQQDHQIFVVDDFNFDHN